MNSRNFSAKILLFGEYGVLKKSRALSIPYHRFSGRLEIGSLNDDNIKKSNYDWGVSVLSLSVVDRRII